MATVQEQLATYTGDAAALLAAIIEMAVADVFYQGIIANMQADNRQTLTDDEKAQIKARLDQDFADAQKAVDDLRARGG